MKANSRQLSSVLGSVYNGRAANRKSKAAGRKPGSRKQLGLKIVVLAVIVVLFVAAA